MGSKAVLAALCVVAALLCAPLLLAPVYAHGEGAESSVPSAGTEQLLKALSLKVLLAALIVAALFLCAALSMPNAPDAQKNIMFAGIALPLLLGTVYLAGTTLHLNAVSETRGPVHWHADFEVWWCGNQIHLPTPTGLANSVGTATLHEHGDNRMHVEGVVMEKSDVDMHHFFEASGGTLTSDTLVMPTDSGMVAAHNGDLCPDGTRGTLQGFVYRTHDGAVQQEKLSDIEGYVLAPYSQVPPGDCIILEFGAQKEMTERVCQTYRQKMKGEANGG